MTKYRRRGHYKINANGTRFWVSEHEANRHNFIVKEVTGKKVVNGQKLIQTICKYCYQKIFFISLDKNKSSFFNNDCNPLSIHKCRKSYPSLKEKSNASKPKQFLNESNKKALDKRADAILARVREREKKELLAQNSQLTSILVSEASKKKLRTIFIKNSFDPELLLTICNQLIFSTNVQKPTKTMFKLHNFKRNLLFLEELRIVNFLDQNKKKYNEYIDIKKKLDEKIQIIKRHLDISKKETKKKKMDTSEEERKRLLTLKTKLEKRKSIKKFVAVEIKKPPKI